MKTTKPFIRRLLKVTIVMAVLLMAMWFIFLILLKIGYTPILKEKTDFKPKEIELLISHYNLKLSDDECIYAARYWHAKGSSILVWISGIKNKDAFISKNLKGYSYSRDSFIGTNIDGKFIRTTLYTNPEIFNMSWEFYEEDDCWIAVMKATGVPNEISNIFLNFWGR